MAPAAKKSQVRKIGPFDSSYGLYHSAAVRLQGSPFQGRPCHGLPWPTKKKLHGISWKLNGLYWNFMISDLVDFKIL
jgi:hypothetical protein